MLIQGYREGLGDLAVGLREWRKWHLVGSQALRQRYSRSYFGQFWIVISQAISITVFGFVWGGLWRIPYEEYIPYVAFSTVLWSLFTGILAESTGILAACNGYFINQSLPFSFAVYSVVYRQLLIAAHNIPILFGVLVACNRQVSWFALLLIPGLVATIVMFTLLSIPIAILCARYRDAVQLVGTLLNLAFFLTPVMWMSKSIPVGKEWIVRTNPFAAALSVVRDPVLQGNIQQQAWEVIGLTAVVSAIVAPLVLGLTKRRLIFWL
jgi:ABC-type polysaccharide/polyol phosphate export permease